jgi:hypothetical protein
MHYRIYCSFSGSLLYGCLPRASIGRCGFEVLSESFTQTQEEHSDKLFSIRVLNRTDKPQTWKTWLTLRTSQLGSLSLRNNCGIWVGDNVYGWKNGPSLINSLHEQNFSFSRASRLLLTISAYHELWPRGVKWPEREADNSHRSSASVKNVCV